MAESRRTTPEEAKRVGDEIGVDWDRFHLEQFRARMDVEFEHGSHDPQTDVTGDDPIVTGKIALAHMKEFPGLLRAPQGHGARGGAGVGGQARRRRVGLGPWQPALARTDTDRVCYRAPLAWPCRHPVPPK